MQLSPKQLKILVAAVCVMLLLVVGLSLRSGNSKPGFTQKTVDKDTGETLLTQPNNTPEKSDNSPIILGSQVLLDKGMTQDQFSFAKSALIEYSKKNLNNKYDRLKILPEGITGSATSIKAKLKQGDKGPVVEVTFNYSELRYVQVFITDSSGSNGGNYASQKFDAYTVPSSPGENLDDLPN